MKRIVEIIVVLGLGIFLVAGNAMATPIYGADPVADFGEGGIPGNALSMEAGYYIWANDEARTSWSVRWTGAGDWYKWSGSVWFSDEDGIQTTEKILWESNDGNLTLTDDLFSDRIDFGIANAGTHWDGFDFTLSGDPGEDYLTFLLGSTYFKIAGIDEGVYIGQNLDPVINYVDSPQYYAAGETRQFEINAPVPEPASLFLLGSGMIGLARLVRRRRFF